MDRRNICVFDFETGGVDPEYHEIIQIGALILHRNTLKTLGKYKSLMKPLDFGALSKEALDINHLTKEELEEAPEPKVVWSEFCNWIKKFNTSRDGSFYGAPIPCGYNIVGFDMILFTRYCKQYGFWDEKNNRQNVLWPTNRLDVFDHMWLYMRTNSDIKKLRLPYILEYCGVPPEEIEKGAHDALWDVEWTANLAIKFLQLADRLTEVNETTGHRRLEIKNCFKNMFTEAASV